MPVAPHSDPVIVGYLRTRVSVTDTRVLRYPSRRATQFGPVSAADAARSVVMVLIPGRIFRAGKQFSINAEGKIRDIS